MAELIIYIAACSSCDRGGIYTFRVGDDMKLTQLAFFPMKDVSYIILSPDGKHLYAVLRKSSRFEGKGEVAAFSVQPGGKLKYLNSLSAGGANCCHIALNGKYLYSANYSDGTLSEYRLAADGSLESLTRVIRHAGKSVHPTRQAGPHIHCVCMVPGRNLLAVTDLGCDKVVLYDVDPEKGISPTPACTYCAKPGAGPRHIIFNRAGDTAYVVNELDNTVSVLAFDGKVLELAQTVSTLPDGWTGENTTAAIRMTADGKHLLASNRGHDSIAVYDVLPDNRLSLNKIVPSGGNGPRDFNISADNSLVIVTNEKSGKVNAFDVNLQPAVKFDEAGKISLPGPLCVIITRSSK